MQDSIARFKTHPDASKFVSPIALDSGQAAGSLIDVLERGGIPVRPAKYADVVLGAQSFYDALTHRDADGDADPQIFHPENHELTDSALTVVKRYRSNSSAWTWGAGSEVPDSPMRAVTLAFWALTEPYENPNQKQKRRRTAPVFY